MTAPAHDTVTSDAIATGKGTTTADAATTDTSTSGNANISQPHSSAADTTSNIAQSQYHESTGSGTSTVTTSGAVTSSSDPSTHPDASFAQKMKGNVSGAISGTVGSMQAATGAALRNKGMEEKGLEKMGEEDQRLGAKRGVMPIGTGQRETEKDA